MGQNNKDNKNLHLKKIDVYQISAIFFLRKYFVSKKLFNQYAATLNLIDYLLI